MSSDYVQNPLTGRLINTNSTTFKSLCKQGYFTKSVSYTPNFQQPQRVQPKPVKNNFLSVNKNNVQKQSKSKQNVFTVQGSRSTKPPSRRSNESNQIVVRAPKSRVKQPVRRFPLQPPNSEEDEYDEQVYEGEEEYDEDE
jgi:hypothetical protein